MVRVTLVDETTGETLELSGSSVVVLVSDEGTMCMAQAGGGEDKATVCEMFDEARGRLHPPRRAAVTH